MNRLYEIRYERENSFSRENVVQSYRKIMNSRVPFALAINSVGIKKGYAVPYVAEHLKTQLKEWKEEFKRRITGGKVYKKLRRVYQGRIIEYEFNTLRDGKEALQRIKDKVREIRRYAKQNNDPLVMRKPNGLLKEFQSKRLKMPKRPLDSAEYVGIEIECITPSGVDLTPLLPFSKYIEVGGDGSINHKDDEEGTEIRVCMKRNELRDVLPGLMQTLKDIGAQINQSCGLHVHLDQRNNLEPEKHFQRLVRSLGLLYTVVPESRRRNRYCKRNRHSDFPSAVRGDRYKAINASAFHRYKTIEIRLFGGTLEAVKIINWIEVLTAIVNGETVMRCPKTFDTALKYWKLSDENLAWLKERQAKFASLNVGMPVSEHETEENQMLLDENQSDDEEIETCGECENSLDDCNCGVEQEAA